MKRLFYLLFGLVLLPAFLYAQGSLSPKDINDNLTNNYFTKTASDARYATTTYGYSSAEVDILLAPKADKTYVDASDEAIILDLDSVEVVIQNLLLEDASLEIAIQNLLFDNDSQDVTIEANKVGVASLEVGLQTHQNNPTGAHAATAISATWTNVQVSLDSIEAAIQGIVVGSGFALESWVNSTLETNFYNKTQTDDTIAAAIAAIPTPGVNQTVTVTAGEDLSAGDVVSLINSGGTMKAYNNQLTVNTSPNGSEYVFNSAATTYCSAVALDSTRFLVAYKDSDTYGKAIVGTISGSTISWGSESAAFENVITEYISTCKIATDKILVVYTNAGTGDGKMVVLSISGTTITINTPASFNTASLCTSNSVTTLSEDKALVASAAGVKGEARIITISGTTPTPYPAAGSAGTEFNAATTNYISCSALSSTFVIVAYRDGGNSNYGVAQVLSISGTTITPGTEYVFLSQNSLFTTAISLTSTKAIISCKDNSNSRGKNCVATITGTDIAYGSFVDFPGNPANSENYGNQISVSKISDSIFLTVFYDGNFYGRSFSSSVTNTSITNNSSSLFNGSNTTQYPVCAFLDSQKSIIAFMDDANSDYGTAVVNTWATPNYASVSGISSGAYSSGSDAVVLIHGTYDGLSSLIPGSPYFVNASFELSTTPVSLTSTIYSSATTTREIHFGVAKSSTEILLDIDYR